MPESPSLSRECLEQLHTWVHIHCACALEHKEFFPGLRAIIEDEVQAAVARARQRMFAGMANPSAQ